MVYKYADPSRDWDAWCDDHPDPWYYYDVDDFNDEDLVSMCCKDEVNIAKNGSKICVYCGKFCEIDPDLSMDKFLESLDNGDW